MDALDSHIAIYGNVKIPRVRCPHCKHQSLVIEGQTACCGIPISTEELPEIYRLIIQPEYKRRPLSAREKAEAIKAQNNKCLYCGREFGTFLLRYGELVRLYATWDHFVPFSYNQNNHSDNAVFACQYCNMFKSNRMFETVEEAQEWLKQRWLTAGFTES